MRLTWSNTFYSLLDLEKIVNTIMKVQHSFCSILLNAKLWEKMLARLQTMSIFKYSLLHLDQFGSG